MAKGNGEEKQIELDETSRGCAPGETDDLPTEGQVPLGDIARTLTQASSVVSS